MPLRQSTAHAQDPGSYRYRNRNGSPRLRRPRRPLVMFAGIIVPLALVGGAGAVLAATGPRPLAPAPKASASATMAAPDPNPNCSLLVPPDPLSAKGLATPYQLVATDRRQGGCRENNAAQSAFVEATILDPATGKLAVYHPLVLDQGRRPAADPAVPTLPAGAVVGLWFGYNGDTLQLRDRNGSLAAGKCVNGLGNSLFGQFADCNAAAFFQAANAAIAAKKLVIPAAQTGKDGMPCPTVRDFGVVDQDQSDNLLTTYLDTGNGRMAPNSAANRKRFGANAALVKNGSDNALVDKFLDPALGCTPFTAPDLGDPGATTSSLALNELAAAAWAKNPVALIPMNDPMALVNDQPSLAKTNLYRAGVNQPALAATDAGGNARGYCRNLILTAPARLLRDRTLFLAAPSPDPAAAKNLFGFLAQRLRSAWDLLGCSKILHKRNPVNIQAAGNVVNDALIQPNANPDVPDPNPTDPTPTPSVSAMHN